MESEPGGISRWYISPVPEADDLYWEGVGLSGRRRGQPRQAWEQVRRALELDPHHPNANVLAGELWMMDFDEIATEELSEHDAAALALPYFDRALDVEPLHADAWNGKSMALRELGRYEEALAAAESGLAALPARVQYLRNAETYRYVSEELYAERARALLALGRRDEAIQVLEQGLLKYPPVGRWQDVQRIIETDHGGYPEGWYLKEILDEMNETGSRVEP